MGVDPRRNLVLIKGKDRTDDIQCIKTEAGRTAVTFRNGESYRYGRHSVERLADPVSIPFLSLGTTRTVCIRNII